MKRCLIMCLLFGVAAFAQENTQDNATEVKASAVKVTATRTERDLDEIPMTVNVITAEDIERNPAPTVPDLLERIPGVRLSKAGNPASPTIMIRGESSSRTLIVVDGVPMSDEMSSIPGVILTLSPADIEQIEVIKGPSSVLYGSGGIGGVVKITTKKGGIRPLGVSYFTIYDSSNKLFENNFSFNGQYKGFFYRASYMAGNAEQLKSKDVNASATYVGNYVRDSNLDKQSYMGSFGYKWDKGHISLSGDRYENTSGTVRITERERHSYKLDSSITDLLPYMSRLTVSLGYTDENKNTMETTGPTGSFPSFTDTDTYSALLATEWLFGSHYISAGIDATHNETSDGRTGTTPRKLEAEMTSISLYLQDEWALLDELSLTLGGRYGKFDKELTSSTIGATPSPRDEGRFTFSVGTVYKGIDNLSLRASYAQGYNMPTVYQMFIGAGTIFKANPDLVPEKSHQVELGAMYTKNDLSLDFAVYASDAKDYISLYQTGVMAYEYLNVSSARTYGAELQAEYKIGAFTPYAGLNYIYRQFDYGNGVKTSKTRTPAFEGNIGVLWEKDFLGRSWYIDLSSDWATDADSIASDGSKTSYNSWIAFNAQLGMRGTLAEGTYYVNLDVKNIADATYETSNANYVMPGVHVILSGGFNF